MITEDIKHELINLVSVLIIDKGFNVEHIEYADFINDLGIDSITFISMIVEIEAHFKIIIPDELMLMDNFNNADAITKIIEDEIIKSMQEKERLDND